MSPATRQAGGRIAYFDNLKYVLIVLVVVGHFINSFSDVFPGYGSLFFFIYLFHMPLFVLTTGLFAQGMLRADGLFRIGRVLQFLLLYLLLYSVVYVLDRAGGQESPFTPWNVVNVSWYLLACAIWYLMIPVLGQVRLQVLIPVLLLVALVAGYFPAIGSFLSLSRVICFAPFFFLGLGLNRRRMLALVRRPPSWSIVAALILVVTFVMVQVVPGQSQYLGLLTADVSYANLDDAAGYGAALRLAWYLVATVVGVCVLLVVPWGRSWITAVGARSLSIYLWHPLAQRCLGLAGFGPLVTDWAAVSPPAAALPVLAALVAAHLFALRLPFGLIAEQALKLGRRLTVERAAVPLSLAATVVLPLAAFFLHPGPVVIDVAR